MLASLYVSHFFFPHNCLVLLSLSCLLSNFQNLPFLLEEYVILCPQELWLKLLWKLPVFLTNWQNPYVNCSGYGGQFIINCFLFFIWSSYINLCSYWKVFIDFLTFHYFSELYIYIYEIMKNHYFLSPCWVTSFPCCWNLFTSSLCILAYCCWIVAFPIFLLIIYFQFFYHTMLSNEVFSF